MEVLQRDSAWQNWVHILKKFAFHFSPFRVQKTRGETTKLSLYLYVIRNRPFQGGKKIIQSEITLKKLTIMADQIVSAW